MIFPEISTIDNICLQLTMDYKKPASIITYTNSKKVYELDQEYIEETGIIKIPIDKTINKNFYSFLEKSNILHHNLLTNYLSFPSLTGHRRYDYETQTIIISKNEVIRDNLINLLKVKDHERIGLLLGYPHDSIQKFNRGEINSEKYFREIRNAKIAKVDIPKWLPYITFIPDSLDIVNGNISESTKTIGETYQKHIESKYPELAKLAEIELESIISRAIKF